MKIVALDGQTLNPGDNPWTPIESLGDLTVYESTPPELIVERLQGVDVVLTNKVVLDEAVFNRLPDLKFVSVTATGYNVVDIKAAQKNNIIVSNIPVYGTDSVAQYTMALLLELCHYVGHHDLRVHEGGWKEAEVWSFWDTPLVELSGKIMGLIGFGRIGSRVGQLANAFGMEVWAHAPSTKPDPGYTPFQFRTVEEIFSGADVVSLHCPQTETNVKFVDSNLLSTMKEDSFFINTARGGLVDEEALLEALKMGKPRAAATDVASNEPINDDNPLLRAPNLIITPHMAWASREARGRLMKMSAENIVAFSNGEPINVVS